MILLSAVVAGAVLAHLRGGRPGRLAGVEFRWGWVAIVAFLLQLVVVRLVEADALGVGLHLLSYGLLFLVIGANWRWWGVRTVALGLLLNFIVIVANGGYMPIMPQAVLQGKGEAVAQQVRPGQRLAGSKDIVLTEESTRLWVLSDILVIPGPQPVRGVFSLGDIVVALGAFWLPQELLLTKKCSSISRAARPRTVEDSTLAS